MKFVFMLILSVFIIGGLLMLLQVVSPVEVEVTYKMLNKIVFGVVFVAAGIIGLIYATISDMEDKLRK